MRTQKWIGFGIVIAFLSIGVSWFLYEKSSAYTRLFVSLDSQGIPYAKVEIQGRHYDVKFSLGSKLPLLLSKTVLAQLEKQDAGTVKVKNLFGDEVELQAFQLKKIALGNLIFQDVLAVEMEERESGPGFIGRPLLVKYNLLFDIHEGTVLMSNRFKYIQRGGYGREDWVQVPLEVGRAGVVIQTGTDIGATKFSLGAATADSLLKSCLVDESLWRKSEQGPACFTSTTFLIGGNEFGRQNLYSLPISNDDFSSIDGILGLDFLSKHIVYLDFDNQQAYIEK